MAVQEHTVSITARKQRRTSTLAALTASLQASTREARAKVGRIALRGQLGPSVGHRDDRRPERYI